MRIEIERHEVKRALSDYLSEASIYEVEHAERLLKLRKDKLRRESKMRVKPRAKGVVTRTSRVRSK